MDKRWDTIFTNANIAAMTLNTSEYGAINDASLAVSGDRIAWIGATSSLPENINECASTIHDMNGAWITPGLIDCHTHIVYGGNRAHEFELRLKGATYEELIRAGGGIHSTVNATRSATAAVLYSNAMRRIRNLYQEGVTTIEIKSGYGLDMDNEAKMLGVARKIGSENSGLDIVTTFLGAHTLPLEYADNRETYINIVTDEMLPGLSGMGLIDAVDGFCESIAFTPAEIERVFDKAGELGLPVKLHADQLSDLGGAELAAGFHALSADHLEYTSEPGIRVMAESGTVAVLLPGAFYTLKETQLPPVDLLREYRVPIAIASDANPGSSPVFSLLTMLNMACILFSLTPEEALAGVTRNAARALGLAGDRGTLEVGKRADFVIWDVSHPAELAYMLGANPCSRVIKNGKPREYQFFNTPTNGE